MPAKVIVAVIAAALLGLIALPTSSHAGPPPDEPLEIGSTPITGRAGLILVATIAPEGGGEMLGRICYPLGEDIDQLPTTSFTDIPADLNPCGDPTPDTLLPAGDYTVTAGVFEPGSQEPIRSLEAPVDHLGPDLIDGAKLSAYPVADTDCDGDFDAVDALNILRKIAALGPFAACVEFAGNLKCDDGLASTDALFLLRYIAALANNYPPGCSPPLPAPEITSPAEGSLFTNFPRQFDVEWEGVSGAASYVVQVDCQFCCGGGEFCTDLCRGYITTAGIEDTSAIGGISGDNPGRVRVWALAEDGTPGLPSEWRTFEFDTGRVAGR